MGFLGMVASGINCYMLFPPLPAAPKAVAAEAKGKAQECVAPEGKLQSKFA